jgi:hypothetical protein
MRSDMDRQSKFFKIFFTNLAPGKSSRNKKLLYEKKIHPMPVSGKKYGFRAIARKFPD